MTRNLLILSHATYVGPTGATAAATYSFFTKDYKPPSQERHIDNDVVHNQNGKFKYIYDNGPGFKEWSPFSINCENIFSRELSGNPNAAVQLARLLEMWEHPGVLGMAAPEGATYTVAWSPNMDKAFRVFPLAGATTVEYEVVVQFEEAQ